MATRALAGGAVGATASYMLTNKSVQAVSNVTSQLGDNGAGVTGYDNQHLPGILGKMNRGGFPGPTPPIGFMASWSKILFGEEGVTTTAGDPSKGVPVVGGTNSDSDLARYHVTQNFWSANIPGKDSRVAAFLGPKYQRQNREPLPTPGLGGSGGSDSGVLDYPPKGLSAAVRALPEWIQLGCGDKLYYCTEKESTFGCDHRCPTAMPDLSKHNNFMAEFLRENPDVYHKYKNLKTKMGVTFADCIKTGVDNKGHPFIKTVGATAGDEESYELFKDFFYPVTAARHPGYDPRTMTQPTNMDLNQLSDTDIDPDCKYVLTTRVRTGRSVRNFRLPPCCGFQERRDLEALVVKGLLNMSGDLKGDYFPLHGSRSYPPKPNGMSEAKEDELRKMGNLFQEPDSTLLLASGMGRHWPDGRGVFHNDATNLFVWVNEEDHLRIVSMQGSRQKPSHEGKQIKEVTARFMRACTEVQKVLKAEGSDFMHNPRLGWVLTCPSNLGTGLRAGTMVKLPKMSARSDWKKLLGKMSLQCRGTGGVDSASTGGTWDVSNSDRIGKGEVDLVNVLIEGAAQLVKWEKLLEAGDSATVDAQIAAKMA